MKDCSIQLTNHPGDLSRVALALAHRGVNIKSLAAISELAIATDNPKQTKKILEES